MAIPGRPRRLFPLGCAFLLAQTGGGRTEQISVRLRPERFVTCWRDSTFRGRDIADNDYQEGFFSGPHGPFSGYEGRSVTLTYERGGGAFRGRLVARGLKPNFSYQMKLVGRPSQEFGKAGDETTNERLGRTGRWWRKGKWEGNTYDWNLPQDRNDPQSVLVGYLIFDYFVTDRFGNATKDFAAVHSIHAFWETHFPPEAAQNASSPNWAQSRYSSAGMAPGLFPTPNTPRPIKPHRVIARRSTGYGYDKDYPDWRVGIRLEIERFQEGTMVLPPGSYDCRFLLTEESFHQHGRGGYWQSALIADRIRFTIRDYVAPPVLHSPPSGATVGPRVSLQGRAEPSEVIQIFSGESPIPLATARSGPHGRWAATLRLPPGLHRLQAVAYCGARKSQPGKAVWLQVE